MYIKIESTRLEFIRFNQSAIRVELYQCIIDSCNVGQTKISNIGYHLILPGSFIGCDRDMRCRYLNSMTVVQRYGKPNIFLTMTFNPRWPEIERELLPFEEAQNRPDLTARIFRSKLIKLKKDIIENKLFGNVAGYVYVVEFQKRGLPHVHFLIILNSEDKIRCPEQYDNFVCAEILDPLQNPYLRVVVLKHMMHGPCGRDFPNNPCMRDRKCKNHYPWEFAEMTTNAKNSYTIYRRRNDGRTATVRRAQLDKRWVVPYNPFMLSKYDCHINIEICSTVKAIKYLYKYVYKGHDCVSFAVTDENNQVPVDEITSYQNARWLSPPEAAWRIFRFCLSEIHPYSSFREAAYKRGLLEADNSIEKCLKEACQYQMPCVLRRLFATLLIYCQPKNPKELWNNFFPYLSEDFAFTFPSDSHRVAKLTLRSIACIIKSMGKSFANFDFGVMNLDDDTTEERRMKEIEDALNIPISEEDLRAVSLLNTEQRHAYDIIYNRVRNKKCGAFFLDGPGGTGKTFVYSTLLANLRIKGIIALAVASSGITALNIAGDRTANYRFKIPINIEENQSSQISKQSALVELIRRCGLIIWDEASMAKRQSIEHFERTLRDICSTNRLFGGKVVVFGGDFRQVLLVIPKVGNGCPPYENGNDIKLPTTIVIQGQECGSLMEQLINVVYPDVNLFSSNSMLMTKKAILTPKNEDTEAINSLLVSKQSGRQYEYKSFDGAVDITTEQYPIEFLNTLHPNGLPPHHLILKRNNPIILLRNLDLTSGLCNGTRLICKSFSANVIDAEIVVGHHKGERVFIPRIPLQPSPGGFHLTLGANSFR
ncbi:hypothetical protein RND81_O263900 [Saponaria officinalis]|uniref:ATP-dependent DNA helicase n=1 Tax=Saponaria officinalis TaxID=3572 RepID=A0AAW1GG65_SAPOF